MGRPAKITYEQVVTAVEALIAETGTYTLDAIRLRLGNQGGKGTIHKHLGTWKAMGPKPAMPVAELPSEVNRALNSWVIQASTAARAHSEELLASEQGNANALADENQQLEDTCDALRVEIDDLVRQRDQALATTVERQKEIERFQADVQRERELAGNAQTAAAEARLKVETNAEHLVASKAEVVRLSNLLDLERVASADAKTAAAVSDAELKNARRDAETERERANSLQGKLDKQMEDVRAMRASYDARLERLEQDHKAALAAQRVETDKARADAQKTLLQVADLRVKLVTAEEKATRLETELARLEAEPQKAAK